MNRVKYFLLVTILLQSACTSEYGQEEGSFVLHDADRTSITFSNDLPVALDLNIFNYMYYYNGAGLAAGDFNNDGLIDLYFTSNVGEEEMYLNRGDLNFENISAKTNISAGQGGWTTGAAVVDINNDGLLDIYISQVGKYRDLLAKNKLLVCTGLDKNGIPQYEDQASKYGLDFQGFSTQAGFFDYDLDGDLDMYLMNHSLHHNGTFGQRTDFLGTIDEASGDKLFRNDNEKFVDVTAASGIESSVIGYGLGLAFGDVNLDGYPDIYVGNDFHENDYLYINNGDGTFTEDLQSQIMHTSRFSMGVDIADVNNDMQPDIISLDMLPEDPVILKMSEGEDAISTFNFKLSYGYNWQYAKNCLQINNGDDTFSDVAMLADVHATDWSWSAMFFDMNLDGNKDIFISNGIPRRMNDIDYINYMSGNEIQQKIQFDKLEEEDLKAIELIPEIKIKNKLFLSKGDLQFTDLASSITNNKVSYSNSTIVADLDNDGDYDVVSNNINDRAFLYENKLGAKGKSVKVKLIGSEKNRHAIGAKVIATFETGRQYFEVSSTKGFQSSMIDDLIIGVGDQEIKDLTVIWPGGSYSSHQPAGDSLVVFEYKDGLPKFNYDELKVKPELAIQDVSKARALAVKHKENPFTEFHREALIPHQTSDYGPALAVGDLNGDGLNDLFVGSAKFEKHQLFYQTESGTFVSQGADILDIDKGYEEIDAKIIDVNGDGHNDLLIGTGGNEWRLGHKYTQPLLYLNDGSGKLAIKEDGFTDVFVTACGLTTGDFDADGDLDVVIGSRATPWTYGLTSKSYLLLNDGSGVFSDATDQMAEGLADIGMVKAVSAFDADLDGDVDLTVAVEWGSVFLFRNDGGSLSKEQLTDRKGWWNFIEPIDYDLDGDVDLIVGNLGQNTRLKASLEEPLRMYVNDFDDNGKEEQILTYYIGSREMIFSNLMELQKTLPSIKNKYQFAKEFANASVEQVLGKQKLKSSKILTADFMDNAVLINEGENYRLESLPMELQKTPYNDMAVKDFDADGVKDIFLVGNYYGSNIQMGRYDADYGTLLLNRGADRYEKVPTTGFKIRGASRFIEELDNGHFVVGINNDSLRVISIGSIKD